MRRISICALLLLMLCGCGFLRQTSYVAVEPHQEEYGEQVDSEALTVTSYLSLKNAILSLVEDGMENGVIRAESYSGNLAVDLNQAVNEVSQTTPLGAYAVNTMTYDYSRIVSYYEIHINTTYRRSLEEIRSVEYVTDMDALYQVLTDAMEGYDTKLVLRIGSFEPFDLEEWVHEITMTHPEFVLEEPEASMELYPSSGAQRVMELQLSYTRDPEELTLLRTQMEEEIRELVFLYGSSNMDAVNAIRLYHRLGRNSLLEQQDAGHGIINSAVGALMEEHASSLGFAQAYRLLLGACEIPCELVSGLKDGNLRYWCRVQINDHWYYADPSLASGGQLVESVFMDEANLTRSGYYMGGEEPEGAELPAYWLPVEAPTGDSPRELASAADTENTGASGSPAEALRNPEPSDPG